MFEEAAAYHARFKPQALLIALQGRTVHESFGGGFDGEQPHALFSGTKSFWGVAALVAQREGLLELDERVSETIDAWNADAWKRQVTLRQLLQLTAGIPFGGLGAGVPEYTKAIATELRNEPGTTFTYGGIPLQVFGAVLARKLEARDSSPHRFLHERVLDPLDIAVAKWRTLRDGTHPLPTGAFMRARDWLAYGSYVLQKHQEFSECFRGSAANPRYGLAWWLAPPGAPGDAFYASGSGGQALYVIPSRELAAVRFGSGGSFNHAAFLKRLAPANAP